MKAQAPCYPASRIAKGRKPVTVPTETEAERPERVLVLMTNGSDAVRTTEILGNAGLQGVACKDAWHLCRELENGADALLMTEEAILGDREQCIRSALTNQPAWSSIPLVAVVREGIAGSRRDSLLSDLSANITLVERPVRMRTLMSVVRGAVRARKHQYETRDALVEVERQRRVYETALSNTADFNYVFDLEGRFVYVNHALLALWGRTLPDAVGKTFFELEYPPELADRLQREIRQVIKTAQPLKNVTPYTTAVGTRYYEYILVPVFASDGTVQAVAGSTRDVTDRKREEEQLRQAERRQTLLLRLLEGQRAISDPEAIMNAAAEAIGRHLEVDRVGFFEVRNGDLLDFTIGWTAGGLPLLSDPFPAAGIGTSYLAEVQSGRTIGIADVRTNPLTADSLFDQIGTVSLIGAPIFRSGRWHAGLYVNHGVERSWNQDEINLVRDVAEQTWDAVERARAENALRESEERFRTLFESMDEGFAVIEMIFDAEGRPVDYRFLEMNPAFEKHTGLRNAAGRTVRELVPELDFFWFETYGKVATTGDPVRFVHGAKEMENRWFDVFAFRPGGPNSRKVALLFNDITTRKQAEHEREQLLREVVAERARLVDVFQRAPSFMCVLSGPNHVFERANERYFQLVGHRDILGKPIREALPDVEGQGFIELLDKAYRTGEAVSGSNVRVFVMRDPNGLPEERFIDFVYQALRDVDGNVTGIHVQGVDLTDRMRAEQALREADQRKDQFLATLAHELRNPLAPISNALQAWQLVERNPQEAERVREMMARQVRQLTRLIDDLLDVSRITRGKIELREDRLDLSTVVESALEGVRPLIEFLRHELTVTLPSEPMTLVGDAGRLMQVFGNLIHNAAKYTGQNGRIWVTVERDADTAIFRVRDNGPGIPREQLTQIFEMFTQVDQTLDRAHGGLGIGLTLVKTLVELHGGEVRAESEGLHRGSEFTVRLPIAESQASKPVVVDQNTMPLPTRRVLVVDDMKPSANTLALMLKSLGQEARTTYDGLSALKIAEEFRPDIVFSDVAMPGMNGHELAKRIRELDAPNPVLVALSGYGQEEDRRRGIDAGFDHYLVKPTSMDALRRLLAVVPDINP